MLLLVRDFHPVTDWAEALSGGPPKDMSREVGATHRHCPGHEDM